MEIWGIEEAEHQRVLEGQGHHLAFGHVRKSRGHLWQMHLEREPRAGHRVCLEGFLQVVQRKTLDLQGWQDSRIARLILPLPTNTLLRWTKAVLFHTHLHDKNTLSATERIPSAACSASG